MHTHIQLKFDMKIGIGPWGNPVDLPPLGLVITHQIRVRRRPTSKSRSGAKDPHM